ncbi:hypothetical protein [Qipengyuania qiaonensis]|uniref:Uncharacterized protein n=1 Tax=Qipengyuania qiaonensis TaxID=2867240 RepID=A0ABS7J9H0_9SPHN|nr:hypothetical protein [Qipengyuania qiaonensis]MBX7483965.1 hypothetical protein [Qipengyuania qiaonensis]
MSSEVEQNDLDIQRVLRAEIRHLRIRQEVEIALIHAYYAMKMGEPVRSQTTLEQQAELLASSPLFDDQWYEKAYLHNGQGGMVATQHYIRAGSFEGLNPGPDFDTMAYYWANPDVAKAGWPALVHYIQFGKSEGRPLE